MKAYEIGDTSKGIGLRLVDRPALKPGFGQVVIKVRATGLNARDLSILKGGLMGKSVPSTRIPLMDVAGDVLLVGPVVSGGIALQQKVRYHEVVGMRGASGHVPIVSIKSPRHRSLT